MFFVAERIIAHVSEDMLAHGCTTGAVNSFDTFWKSSFFYKISS